MSNDERMEGIGGDSLERCAQLTEHILVSPCDGKLRVFLLANDAVPDDDFILHLEETDVWLTSGWSRVWAALTPRLFSYSALTYRKSCFVFQLNKGVRSGAWSVDTLGVLDIDVPAVRLKFTKVKSWFLFAYRRALPGNLEMSMRHKRENSSR